VGSLWKIEEVVPLVTAELKAKTKARHHGDRNAGRPGNQPAPTLGAVQAPHGRRESAGDNKSEALRWR
jgi:hypothetical protein